MTVAITAEGMPRQQLSLLVSGLPRPESLGDYRTYVAWVAPPSMHPVQRLGEVADGRTDLGVVDLEKFVFLLTAEASGQVTEPVGDELLRAINRVLASRPPYTRLVRTGTGYGSRLQPVTRAPLQLLVPVAESAAWLLEHGEGRMVRRCGGRRCVLLFYDTTRNRSRRWCSMDGCGSPAKAAAYYRRARARRRSGRGLRAGG